jgi:hypothetical protein
MPKEAIKNQYENKEKEEEPAIENHRSRGVILKQFQKVVYYI